MGSYRLQLAGSSVLLGAMWIMITSWLWLVRLSAVCSCVHFSTNPRNSPFPRLEGPHLASWICSVELQVTALHLSHPMCRYLQVTNQIAVRLTQVPKQDYQGHCCLIMSAISPLAVKPRFQDLDMVRFLALYTGSAVTVVFCVSISLLPHLFTHQWSRSKKSRISGRSISCMCPGHSNPTTSSCC